MSDTYVGAHRAEPEPEPEFVEDVEPDGWDDDHDFYDESDFDTAFESAEKVDVAGPPPQDTANPGPEPIPEAIHFAVNALMDHYTYDEIRDAVERLHEARAHLTTAFSVYLTREGSTLVNTEVPGVSVDREPSTEDMRRAARDVAEFHEHQRIASMVRAVL